MLGAIGGALGKLFKPVTDIVEGWQKRKSMRLQTELEIEKAKQDLIAKKETADINWNMIMAEGSQESWKDEFWTVVIAAPLITVFFPGIQPYVIDGFEALNNLPAWYRTAVGTAIGAAFGRQEIIKYMKQNGKEKARTKLGKK